MHFKIGWASLTVGSKFTVFALFFCITGLGALYLEGLIYGLVHFRNFFGSFLRSLDRNLMYTVEVGVKRRFNVPSYS